MVRGAPPALRARLMADTVTRALTQ